MSHRYTGTIGRRLEGNIPRAHEVQGTARLLVQQCIDHINHNGGWGQMRRQIALRDGTIVKAIVLQHQRGWEPIVRVEIFAPQTPGAQSQPICGELFFYTSDFRNSTILKRVEGVWAAADSGDYDYPDDIGIITSAWVGGSTICPVTLWTSYTASSVYLNERPLTSKLEDGENPRILAAALTPRNGLDVGAAKLVLLLADIDSYERVTALYYGDAGAVGPEPIPISSVILEVLPLPHLLITNINAGGLDDGTRFFFSPGAGKLAAFIPPCNPHRMTYDYGGAWQDGHGYVMNLADETRRWDLAFGGFDTCVVSGGSSFSGPNPQVATTSSYSYSSSGSARGGANVSAFFGTDESGEDVLLPKRVSIEVNGQTSASSSIYYDEGGEAISGTLRTIHDDTGVSYVSGSITVDGVNVYTVTRNANSTYIYKVLLGVGSVVNERSGSTTEYETASNLYYSTPSSNDGVVSVQHGLYVRDYSSSGTAYLERGKDDAISTTENITRSDKLWLSPSWRTESVGVVEVNASFFADYFCPRMFGAPLSPFQVTVINFQPLYPPTSADIQAQMKYAFAEVADAISKPALIQTARHGNTLAALLPTFARMTHEAVIDTYHFEFEGGYGYIVPGSRRTL